jgi:hypothetical protein
VSCLAPVINFHTVCAAEPDNDSAVKCRHTSRRRFMTITLSNLAPIVALIAGVLILIMPRLLNFIVAIYLIIIGLLGLGIFR